MQGCQFATAVSFERKVVPSPLPNPTYFADLLATRATPLLLPRQGGATHTLMLIRQQQEY